MSNLIFQWHCKMARKAIKKLQRRRKKFFFFSSFTVVHFENHLIYCTFHFTRFKWKTSIVTAVAEQLRWILLEIFLNGFSISFYFPLAFVWISMILIWWKPILAFDVAVWKSPLLISLESIISQIMFYRFNVCL